MSEVLTTSEVARLCGVSFRTVIRWVERGVLQAYKLPGRGDHRIPMEEVRRFMRENGIPEPGATAAPAKRILITEDEPAMAHAIERVLARAGYQTAIAPNGFAAGAMLHTFKPGLMTLDLRMPGLDGLGVLRFLQQTPLPFPLKTLVVSADTDARLQEARALGADAVVRKPFSNEELLATVQRLYGESPTPATGT